MGKVANKLKKREREGAKSEEIENKYNEILRESEECKASIYRDSLLKKLNSIEG